MSLEVNPLKRVLQPLIEEAKTEDEKILEKSLEKSEEK